MSARMEAAEFTAAGLGRWTKPTSFTVTREGIAAYAAATNDPVRVHRDGDVAPPVYSVVASFPSFLPAMMEIVPQRHQMRAVHGAQDFYYYEPVIPGMALEARSCLVGVVARSSGTAITVRTAISSEGRNIVDQVLTGFVRQVIPRRSAGEGPPAHALPEGIRDLRPLAEVQQKFDADQTFRYAKASGDDMPLHLDNEVARSVGLPGIIIHGLCSMAFASSVIVEHACAGDTRRLRRLAVRFAKPVLPGQTITTRLWPPANGSHIGRHSFETTSDSGTVVLTDGVAETRP